MKNMILNSIFMMLVVTSLRVTKNLRVDFIVVDQPEDGDIDDEDGINDEADGKKDGIVKISITPAEVGTYEFKLRSAKRAPFMTP
ncbi:MAG: hypothetical protein ACOX23_04255 [Peptococcia bacterium]